MNCPENVCIQKYQFQESLIKAYNVSEINPLLALDLDSAAQHPSAQMQHFT